MQTVTVQKTKKYLIVKIPLRSVQKGRVGISSRAQKIVDGAIQEGLRDIAQERTFGPFASVGEFKRALRKVSLHK